MCSKCFKENKAKEQQQHKEETAPKVNPSPSPELQPTQQQITELVSPLQIPQTSPTTFVPEIEEKMSDLAVAPSTSVDNIVAPSNPNVLQLPVSASPSPSPDSANSASSSSSSSGKKPKLRCQTCSKKLTPVTFFSCRCSTDAAFCSTHRYPHAHSCTYDMKKHQANLLAKANPEVKASTLEKI